MPDYGTARADFPGGRCAYLVSVDSASLGFTLQTRLYHCHDYKASERDFYSWETTVSAQKSNNVHIRDGVTEEEFVAMRRQRDATLKDPLLMLPSIQINLRAGRLPEPESNGARYLKIPLRFESGLC